MQDRANNIGSITAVQITGCFVPEQVVIKVYKV